MKWPKRKKRCGIRRYCGRELYIGRKDRGISHRRIRRRREKNRYFWLAAICACLLAAGGLLLKIWTLSCKREVSATAWTMTSATEEEPASGREELLSSGAEAPSAPGEKELSASGREAPPPLSDTMEELLAQADRAVSQYDYDRALELFTGNGIDREDSRIAKKLSDIDEVKQTLVEQDISQITHIFFHILVEDPGRTFLDTAQGKGYNSVMTTIPEFEKILEQMYERGYVLVSLHDMVAVTVDETGQEQMEKKKILLPPGKKAFVMSQDDVNYYEYMEGSGCADKMLLDDSGKPVCEYIDQDGTVRIGEYDLVPILDNFVEKHPDFSYRGAKATLALTGYNGVLGYRTDETYDPASPNCDPNMKANPNIEADRAYVKKLTQALKEDGYEFASHSWGHRDYGKIELEHMMTDIDRWERNVAPLLPEPCDTMIYPFGSDVGDWKPYADNNEKYQYLHSLGFRYFCNVDSRPCWVQTDDRFFRQARRNLDGYRLWMDYGGGEERLSDLIDVKEVFDVRRPTPVGWQ